MLLICCSDPVSNIVEQKYIRPGADTQETLLVPELWTCWTCWTSRGTNHSRRTSILLLPSSALTYFLFLSSDPRKCLSQSQPTTGVWLEESDQSAGPGEGPLAAPLRPSCSLLWTPPYQKQLQLPRGRCGVRGASEFQLQRPIRGTRTSPDDGDRRLIGHWTPPDDLHRVSTAQAEME